MSSCELDFVASTTVARVAVAFSALASTRKGKDTRRPEENIRRRYRKDALALAQIPAVNSGHVAVLVFSLGTGTAHVTR